MPDVRVNISGSYMIFGIPLDRLAGDTLAAKLAALYAYTPTEFQNIAKQHGFQVPVAPGALVANPAGYMVVTHAPVTLADYVRWSVYDVDLKAKVLQTIEDMMQSYEQLQGTDYKTFADLLSA